MNVSLSFSPLPSRKKKTKFTIKCLENTTQKDKSAAVKYVICGGGIAGVSVAKELARLHSTHDNIDITIINPSNCLKESNVIMQVTKHLQEFDIFERTTDSFKLVYPSINIVESVVTSIDFSNNLIYLKGLATSLKYETYLIKHLIA
jgi:NADH dehydrogenase FAD-containing subunit